VKHDITAHPLIIRKSDHQRLKQHRSFMVWLTGLSGAGKSTLAVHLERELYLQGMHTYVLDGDNLRKSLNRDLGFTESDRRENIRRIGEVAKMMVDAGLVTIVAMISPYREEREGIRQSVGEDEFVEVFVKCKIEECERRDPKGLYKKARLGLIPQFTGFDSPYEEPGYPELVLETDRQTLTESLQRIMTFLREQNYIRNV
jgi:adenylylsulfate kinase